jgi:hypothetical protein
MRTDLTDAMPNVAGSGGTSTLPKPAAGGDSLGSPLQWWRTVPVTALSDDLLEEATRAMSRFAILGEPNWRAALAGEATTAVGIALRATKYADAPTTLVDLAMTALLRPSFNGNPAAALVMASIIKRVVVGAEGQVLATGWLERGRLIPDKSGLVRALTMSEPSDKRR